MGSENLRTQVGINNPKGNASPYHTPVDEMNYPFSLRGGTIEMDWTNYSTCASGLMWFGVSTTVIRLR